MDKNIYNNDRVTKNLLTKAGIEEPSVDFTQKLMQRIQTSNAFVYTPVITKVGWIIYSAIVVSLIAASLFAPSVQSSTEALPGVFSVVQQLSGTVVSALLEKTQSLTWLLFVMAAGWFLFFADGYLKKKMQIS